jgi:hypothetical protein
MSNKTSVIMMMVIIIMIMTILVITMIMIIENLASGIPHQGQKGH